MGILISGALLFITSCFLSTASVVMIWLPPELNGRVTILFNQEGYKPLVKKNNAYGVFVGADGVFKTSTSFAEKHNVTFFLIPYKFDTLRNLTLDSNRHAIYYANWYTGSSYMTLSKNYQQEMFVAYCYDTSLKYNRDYLIQFMLAIKADTTINLDLPLKYDSSDK